MKGFVTNIEEATLANTDFRRVLYTATHSQLVVMCISEGQDIGEEVHDVDQFIRLEQGEGQSILNGVERDLVNGSVVVIPAGIRHNIKNTGSGDMKLYTLYAPSHHKDATIHRTKEDALQDEEHFDGVTTDDLSS